MTKIAFVQFLALFEPEEQTRIHALIQLKKASHLVLAENDRVRAAYGAGGACVCSSPKDYDGAIIHTEDGQKLTCTHYTDVNQEIV